MIRASHAVVIVAALAIPRAARADGDVTTKMLGELSTAADCTNAKSPLRPWCIAADGWVKGKPASLPRAKVLVGITIELEDGKPVSDALINRVTLSALALATKDGKRVAKITNIKPENDDEATSAGMGVASVTMVLKAKAKVATLPKDLATYVKTLPAGATYEMTKAATGWTWTGASGAELRKVGGFWVSVETPAAGNGIFVGIYTDKLK